MYSFCRDYNFRLLFQMLATSFGLTRQSSSQYLQKLNSVGSYNITGQYDGIPFTTYQHLKQ
jgi:hypothetical protein